MPNSMRGQASAVYLFVITMVGLGIGPTAVALGTDFVFGDDNALRYSLLIVTGIALVGAMILLGMGLLTTVAASIACRNGSRRAQRGATRSPNRSDPTCPWSGLRLIDPPRDTDPTPPTLHPLHSQTTHNHRA